MARDHLKRYEMVLETPERVSGRKRKPGDVVELYGDRADRYEAERRAHAKRHVKATKVKSKAKETED